jgi:hypothetical protein
VPGPVDVRDGELVYAVDVLGGHKTGTTSTSATTAGAPRRSRGARVLDAFCYDGLFGVLAALGGAREVLCSTSPKPRSRARGRTPSATACSRACASSARTRCATCASASARASAGTSSSLDPPAFARNKTELAGAERGYRELNLRALRLLDPGGALVSASCSHAVRPELFLAFLARAAHDAGRSVWLEELAGAVARPPAPRDAAGIAVPQVRVPARRLSPPRLEASCRASYTRRFAERIRELRQAILVNGRPIRSRRARPSPSSCARSSSPATASRSSATARSCAAPTTRAAGSPRAIGSRS